MLDKQINNSAPTDNLGEKPQSHFGDHYKSKVVTQTSRILRQDATKSENMLWEALRNRQLAGLKFRRQHQIASSVLDFYCHEKRLAVEVDGGYHLQQDIHAKDRYRQELIENYGITFFRCTSTDVEENLARVLEQILDATSKIPLPQGEGAVVRQLADEDLFGPPNELSILLHQG
ncbi:endonuclease domain-containing protein [Candidatus Neomarinimicrobiota bacterium]